LLTLYKHVLHMLQNVRKQNSIPNCPRLARSIQPIKSASWSATWRSIPTSTGGRLGTQ